MAEINTINQKIHYILLKERSAIKLPDKNSYGALSSKEKCIDLLKGAILFRRLAAVANPTSGLIRLRVYESPAYFSDCPLDDVNEISEEEAKLLLSISSMSKRFELYENDSLKIGTKMTLATKVYVNVQSQGGGKQELLGTIRYKGPLPKNEEGSMSGTMFGIELVEGRGRGTTDGKFKGIRHFKCDPDCGMFVSFEKLRLYEDKVDDNKSGVISKVKNKLSEWSEGVSQFISGEHAQSSLEKLGKSGIHQVDDRVWVYVNDKLTGGHIKYIGRIPGGRNVLAGIELDHAVGKGNGEFYGKQLFHCSMNYAHFTPIANVISQDKLQELYKQPDEVQALKDLPSTPIPQTAEDIVKMESKFSKQSSADVIKEQEQLLKKIKQDTEQKQNVGARGIETSLDEHWKAKNDNLPKVNSNVSYATTQMNTHAGDPKGLTFVNHQVNHQPVAASQSNLDVGSMVEVLSKNQNPRYGVIKWLGFTPQSDQKVAGLELEEEMDACTDGTFLGKRYFKCPNRRGFFVHLKNCAPDSRFNRNSIENPASKRLTGTEFGPYKSPLVEDDFIPPPETLQVYLREGARGIQGHHNSCYLDATLFAAFAFSFVMDSILLRLKDEKDIKQYEKVQTVLRNNIVYPLRKFGFVRADRVMELRELLDELGTVTGLVGEEKDPEEFLLTLLQQVLKSEPFLKIKYGRDVRQEYFYQVLADKDVERVLPSVEELLKRSFHQQDLKLAEVPSCLIVQMPRFGKGFKMYDRILPSMTINIGELVDNLPQDCAVCGRLAFYHCRECFTVTGNEDTDSSGNFCKDCNERVHSHVRRKNHKRTPIAVRPEVIQSYGNKAVEHREMELFAVICIETSHYVTFAKCEDPAGEVRWCFFDSMADRVGTKNGYNVPSVTECPEIIEWLSSEKQNRERIINTSDKEMPDRVRRILGDAYVCLYESKEMAMYK